MLRLPTVPIRGHRYVISFCPRLTVKLYMSSTLHDDRAMSEPTLKKPLVLKKVPFKHVEHSFCNEYNLL